MTSTARPSPADATARLIEAQVRLVTAQAAKAEAHTTILEDKLRERDLSNAANWTFHLYGAIEGISVWQTMRGLERFSRIEPKHPLELLITSPGGSLAEGLALFDHIAQLRRRSGLHVTTVGLGMAASMAGILLQAGDVRVMTRESSLMIHESTFTAAGSIGDVQDTVGWLKKVHERIVDIFVSRAKISRRQFVANWKRKSWWLSADDALKLGFIDEVR